MDKATLAAKARHHWKTWRPREAAALEAAGELNEATQGAAALAMDRISDLMRLHGYREHEATEVAMKEFILLAPEAPAEDDWEAAELAEMEAEYQDRMKDPEPQE